MYLFDTYLVHLEAFVQCQQQTKPPAKPPVDGGQNMFETIYNNTIPAYQVYIAATLHIISYHISHHIISHHTISYLDVWGVVLVDDLIGQELRIRLDGPVVEVAPDEPLHVEHRVLRIGGGLVLRGVAYKPLPAAARRVPRDVGGRDAVPLVICDDFDVAIFYDSNNGVRGAQIDPDELFSGWGWGG